MKLTNKSKIYNQFIKMDHNKNDIKSIKMNYIWIPKNVQKNTLNFIVEYVFIKHSKILLNKLN